jgi:hypothetical protein
MMRFLHGARSRPKRESDHTRLVRIRLNIRSKVPREALLYRLDSTRGDDSVCDGCRKCIARENLRYELEFRVPTGILIVKLHRECWDCWRIELADTREPRCAVSRLSRRKPC